MPPVNKFYRREKTVLFYATLRNPPVTDHDQLAEIHPIEVGLFQIGQKISAMEEAGSSDSVALACQVLATTV